MQYINEQPNESGNYGNPQTVFVDGMLALPDELIPAYISAKGFVLLTVESGVVTAVEINQAAYAAYMAEEEEEEERRRTADRDYEPDELLTADGTMYRVVLPIFAGTRLTIGTNVIETTIEAELARKENAL